MRGFHSSLVLGSILVAERGAAVGSLRLDPSLAAIRSPHHYAGDPRRQALFMTSITTQRNKNRLSNGCRRERHCHERKCRRDGCWNHSPSALRSMSNNEHEDEQRPTGRNSVDDDEDGRIVSSSDLEPAAENASKPANSTVTDDDAAQSTTSATANAEGSTVDANQWQANDFESDYQLLKVAMARQSAKTDLQQQRRKYTLDYGFARNRRPLFLDLLSCTIKIGLWVAFLAAGRAAGSDGVVDGVWNSVQSSESLQLPWWRALLALATHGIVTMTTLHHWIVGMTLPLILLSLIKSGKMGPPGRIQDEYFKPPTASSDLPSFFYTSEKLSEERAKKKDTGNFALCLLESWSSAVILAFVCGVSKKAFGIVDGRSNKVNACARMLTRLGSAAALHQYPSLLFELRRNDQPRPLCRSTAYMQRAVKSLLGWLPISAASDLAVLLSRKRTTNIGAVYAGSIVASFFSVIAPIFHLVALGRIVRVSKCSGVSLSEATSFPTEYVARDTKSLLLDRPEQVKWRYQLRWRTPQRVAETLRSWGNYFLTGHVPLLFEMDDLKKQPIRFDDFSTEGTHYLMHKEEREPDTVVGDDDDPIVSDDSIPHADAIVESLSLIFRDRESALRNATQARLAKHQESYETKTLDDVLGVAVQQTFGLGLSYDFDHFDTPGAGEEVSIHQLRARMAKSAIRRKKELDSAMKKEFATLRRLKNSFAADANNREEAEQEMMSVERDIRKRHAKEVDRMRNALFTLIPTNANMPKGAERYDSPIMVAEYVDLNAPFEKQGELKATIESAPDSLSMIEDYVRRDFGDEAADAYRRDEIAARIKEKELLSKFRQRYGELEDDGSPPSE